jgi:hypothetical protein
MSGNIELHAAACNLPGMLGTHCSAVLLSYVVSSNTSNSDQRPPDPSSCAASTPALLTRVLMSWQAYSRRFLNHIGDSANAQLGLIDVLGVNAVLL